MQNGDAVPNSSNTTPLSTNGATTPAEFPRSGGRPLKYRCTFEGCDKAYSRPVRLAEHQRTHTNERIFVCTVPGCGKDFTRDSHLKHHIKVNHEDNRNFICDWPGCGKGYHTGQRLKAHIKAHEKKEQYKCTGFGGCEQTFRKQETLDRHIKRDHLQEKPFQCDHIDAVTGEPCSAAYDGSSSLAAHKAREHSGNRYWCNICTPDLAVTDPELRLSIVTADSQAVGFPTYSELQTHLKIVHPPTCTDCGHQCATQRELRAHIDIEHGTGQEQQQQPAYACDFPGCERKFTRRGNLNVHKRTVHEKEKNFVCGGFDLSATPDLAHWDGRGACGRALGSKVSLLNHIRSQHLHAPRKGKAKKQVKEEPTDAPMSNVPPQQSALGMLTGVGYEESRAIPCAIILCDNRFTRAHDLSVHLQVVHGYSEDDAAETAAEKEALAGGDFWVGGGVDPTDFDLAQRLNYALNTESSTPYSFDGLEPMEGML